MYSSVIHTQWNGMQKNYSFSASFRGVSLVGLDNLLTHTHSNNLIQGCSYVFVRRNFPIRKNSSELPLFAFSYPFAYFGKRE